MLTHVVLAWVIRFVDWRDRRRTRRGRAKVGIQGTTSLADRLRARRA